MQPSYDDLIAFHGHSCPGLAMGYRMSQGALTALYGERAEDEELVAIVENKACGVDALQCLSGCTFGKGNLIFKDHGKQVFTLYSRTSKKGVRVSFNAGNVPEDIHEDRSKFISWILTAPQDDVITLREVKIDEPEPAMVVQSVTCEVCGESVMDTKTQMVQGKRVCVPCAKQLRDI